MIFVELRNYWLDMCLCNHITVFSYLFYRISTTRLDLRARRRGPNFHQLMMILKTSLGLVCPTKTCWYFEKNVFCVWIFVQQTRPSLMWFFWASLGKSLSDKKERTTEGILKMATKSENRKLMYGDCYLGNGFDCPHRVIIILCWFLIPSSNETSTYIQWRSYQIVETVM